MTKIVLFLAKGNFIEYTDLKQEPILRSLSDRGRNMNYKPPELTKAITQEQENALKYICTNVVTKQNYEKHIPEIRSFFHEMSDFNEFITKYILDSYTFFVDEFIDASQTMDAYPYVRYQQESVYIHDFYNLKFMLHGTSTFFINGQCVFLHESDILLIAPYARQQIFVFEDDILIINIMIRREAAEKIFSKILESQNPVSGFLMSNAMHTSESNPYLHFRTHHDKEVEDLLMSIFQYFFKERKRNFYKDIIQENTIENAFLLLLAKYPLISDSQSSPQGDNMEIYRILTYMRQNISTITLAELSGHFNYNQSYISRFIKKYTGQTFSQLIQHLKLKEAERLLENTSLTAEQIAVKIGYSSKANFYRIFQAHHHMTPLEYRKRKKDDKTPPEQA